MHTYSRIDCERRRDVSNDRRFSVYVGAMHAVHVITIVDVARDSRVLRITPGMSDEDVRRQLDVIVTDFAAAERDRQMRNAYDNTIVFTDRVLDEFIGVIGAEHAVSSLYFASDHGENGAESVTLPFSHGNLTTEVLRVPLIVWLSPEYQAARPRQSEALRSHADVPFSSDVTFHTVLDVAGLSCALLLPERSIASREFLPGPRIVVAMHGPPQDYDKDIVPNESRRKGWKPVTPRDEKPAAQLEAPR